MDTQNAILEENCASAQALLGGGDGVNCPDQDGSPAVESASGDNHSSVVETVAGESPSDFEVELPSGEHCMIADPGQLRREILSGKLRRSFKARKLTGNGTAKADAQWRTVEEIAVNRTDLRPLYRPVWSSTLKWLGYGAITGIVLKMLDTTVTMFAIHPMIGCIWIGWILFLVVPKKQYVLIPAVLFFVNSRNLEHFSR